MASALQQQCPLVLRAKLLPWTQKKVPGWSKEQEETAAAYLYFCSFCGSQNSLFYCVQHSLKQFWNYYGFLFTVFNKLAEFWLEICIAKAIAIINHNSLAKGTVLISASFAIQQGANTVRMSYSSTMRILPAVIATVALDTL